MMSVFFLLSEHYRFSRTQHIYIYIYIYIYMCVCVCVCSHEGLICIYPLCIKTIIPHQEHVLSYLSYGGVNRSLRYFFSFWLKIIDYEYSLETPHCGGFNMHLQSKFGEK